MAKARIAQIGIGGYGAAIRKGLLSSPNTDLVAVCDVNEQLCQQIAAETGARVLPAEAILADESIDAVALVLPNHLHRPLCEQAAAAGKHVYCEKPIANHTADAAAMIRACRDAGVTLMIGHNYRRDAAYRVLKRWLEEEAIGMVVDCQCESSHAGGLRLDAKSWRFDPELCPALPLIQLGIHVIDLCNHCFGRPVEVTGLQRHRLIPGDNMDATFSLIAYESGVLVSVASHYVTPGRTELLVSGVGGRIHAQRGRIELSGGAAMRLPELDEIDTQAEEMDEFARAVLGEAEVETTGEGGLLALAVCEAATLSAREGRTVQIDELPGVAGVG